MKIFYKFILILIPAFMLQGCFQPKISLELYTDSCWETRENGQDIANIVGKIQNNTDNKVNFNSYVNAGEGVLFRDQIPSVYENSHKFVTINTKSTYSDFNCKKFKERLTKNKLSFHNRKKCPIDKLSDKECKEAILITPKTSPNGLIDKLKNGTIPINSTIKNT